MDMICHCTCGILWKVENNRVRGTKIMIHEVSLEEKANGKYKHLPCYFWSEGLLLRPSIVRKTV